MLLTRAASGQSDAKDGFSQDGSDSAPSSFVLHLHVDNADGMIDNAVEAGARLVRAPQDEFYGERGGKVRDPFGYDWLIGHSIEDVDPAEMQRRYTELCAGESP